MTQPTYVPYTEDATGQVREYFFVDTGVAMSVRHGWEVVSIRLYDEFPRHVRFQEFDAQRLRLADTLIDTMAEYTDTLGYIRYERDDRLNC